MLTLHNSLLVIDNLIESTVSGIRLQFNTASINWISCFTLIPIIQDKLIVFINTIMISCGFIVELLLMFVTQSSNDDTNQCSNNKRDDKCDHYTDSNCFSC